MVAEAAERDGGRKNIGKRERVARTTFVFADVDIGRSESQAAEVSSRGPSLSVRSTRRKRSEINRRRFFATSVCAIIKEEEREREYKRKGGTVCGI